MDKASQLEKLRQQRDRINRQIARTETRLKQQERTHDTRRKILAGAAALTLAAQQEDFCAALHAHLRQYIEPRDRHLFPDVFTPEELAHADAEAKRIREENRQKREQAMQ